MILDKIKGSTPMTLIITFLLANISFIWGVATLFIMVSQQQYQLSYGLQAAFLLLLTIGLVAVCYRRSWRYVSSTK